MIRCAPKRRIKTKEDEPAAAGKSSTKPKQERLSAIDPDVTLMKWRTALDGCLYCAGGERWRLYGCDRPGAARNDRGLAPAVAAQVEQRCDKLPDSLLADTGAMTTADIVMIAQIHAFVQGVSPPQASQVVLETGEQSTIRTQPSRNA